MSRMEMKTTIPNDQLSPALISSKLAYLIWATFYSLIHLGISYFLLSKQSLMFPILHSFSVAVLIIGPFFYFLDLYLRLIFLPYWRIVRQGGGLPSEAERKHPYDFSRKVGSIILISALLGFAAATVVIWAEIFSHLRAWPGAVLATVCGFPAMAFATYHGFFVWKGPEDAK